ncbi:MAG: hypothetical protein DI565_12975 [Ancylobacter novellus]|uniref:Uncharacterized protein n=1 Tax=Ancylobacter novellus TaxID=921 RepID=A0A2W5KHJ1_ANCNO|nr:MAG: hypothetical protein DI565_12975 [Ancylobacter novellus]
MTLSGPTLASLLDDRGNSLTVMRLLAAVAVVSVAEAQMVGRSLPRSCDGGHMSRAAKLLLVLRGLVRTTVVALIAAAVLMAASAHSGAASAVAPDSNSGTGATIVQSIAPDVDRANSGGCSLTAECCGACVASLRTSETMTIPVETEALERSWPRPYRPAAFTVCHTPPPRAG